MVCFLYILLPHSTAPLISIYPLFVYLFRRTPALPYLMPICPMPHLHSYPIPIHAPSPFMSHAPCPMYHTHNAHIAGQFFMWLSSTGILLVGAVVQLSSPSATFYPLAMSSGLLFTTGNLMLPAIVRAVGLGVGLLMWSSSCMLVGWAADKYSPLHTPFHAHIPHIPHSFSIRSHY